MRQHNEHDEQAALIAWCRLSERKHPELRWIYANPNGGHRHKVVAAKLKAEGVAPGVPDLFLPEPRGDYHGFYLELKKQHGGRLSDAQAKWIARLREAGYCVVVAAGWDEARAQIEQYLSEVTDDYKNGQQRQVKRSKQAHTTARDGG